MINLRIISNDVNTEKWQEIEILIQKIIELENYIKYLERNHETDSPKYAVQKIKHEIKCYNCNGKDHIARNCNKQLLWSNCNKSGHISRFCKTGKRSNIQREAFQRLEETNDNSNIEYDEASSDYEKESEDNNEFFSKLFQKKKKLKDKKKYQLPR